MPHRSDEKIFAAFERFDEANARDPNITIVNEAPAPRELVYARRMTAWLLKLEPHPSEPLELAARSQHLMRWSIPRGDYPMDRAGYLRWREDLQTFHAEKAGEILREVGYDPLTIARVGSLIRKEKIKSDPEMQLLEDVICLVFLENYFAEFARDRDEPKLIRILRKTWNKMSVRGHAAAKAIDLPQRERMLIEKALSPQPETNPPQTNPPRKNPPAPAKPASSTGDSADPQ
jgi:hypothetical protein